MIKEFSRQNVNQEFYKNGLWLQDKLLSLLFFLTIAWMKESLGECNADGLTVCNQSCNLGSISLTFLEKET